MKHTYFFPTLLAFHSLIFSSLSVGEESNSPMMEAIKQPPALQFGIKGSYIYQEANYQIKGLNIMFPNAGQFSPQLLGLASTLGPHVITGIEDSYHVSSTYLEWIPRDFLRFSARLGTIEGQADVNLIQPFNSFRIEYDGYVYGFGSTLFWEDQNSGFFALFNAEWNQAHFENGGSNEIWVLKPKLGYSVTDKVKVWIGATRQENNQQQSGVAQLAPFGTTNFTAELTDVAHWNYVTGIRYDLSDRFNLAFEGGFGNRKHLALFASYEF